MAGSAEVETEPPLILTELPYLSFQAVVQIFYNGTIFNHLYIVSLQINYVLK